MEVMRQEIYTAISQVLIRNGFAEKDALLCSEIFTANTVEGVPSHGVNRFPYFIETVQKGFVDITGRPVMVQSFNAMEQWDGNFGPGPINASLMTARAQHVADAYGIGCVALRNTNHWMRAGYYGWTAANAGYILIAWTNTIPNLPPWGSDEPRTGNNPLVIAVPRAKGNVVLDFAMSQFSYGKMQSHKIAGTQLPFFGGYNEHGELTTDPAAIYKTMRALPIGMWKGSGLSLMLDMIAALLSGGNATKDLTMGNGERGVSQVFVAIDPKKFSEQSALDETADDIIEYYKNARPASEGDSVLYPGERVKRLRDNPAGNKVFVEDSVWNKIMKLNEV